MKDAILSALSVIIDPDLGKDIVTLGFIKDLTIKDGEVAFTIELTTPACPVKDLFKQQAHDAVMAVVGVKQVRITMGAQQKLNPLMGQDKKNLERVTHIIAVSSCKGGVGKSTVALNLAYTLKQQGASVGIFDADVYGPSLPTMIASNQELVLEGNDIKPIDYDGMKCMSFGYALDAEGNNPAILRGPMVSQIISQFVLQTAWGACDYLIIDMPPGTGDVQLTLCQLLPLAAAVIVTTPQYISFVDVVKGIEMFDKLKVPVIGAVENMSYLMVNGNKETPFGTGSLTRLTAEFGFKNTLELELDQRVSRAGDTGTPFVKADPLSNNATRLATFTKDLVREISVIAHGMRTLPKVGYTKEEGIILEVAGVHYGVFPKPLRLACRSALSRDEFTNELLIDPETIPDDIYPLAMNPVGNYALGINWNDGHASLYPYDQLLELATPLPPLKL